MLVMGLLLVGTIVAFSTLPLWKSESVIAQENLQYVVDTVEKTCTDIDTVLQSGPRCKPRSALLSLPSRSDILEVIPNQVEIQRCQGMCPNSMHHCLPSLVQNKTIEVIS